MGRKEYEAIIGAMYDSLEVVAHNRVETEYAMTLIEKHEEVYEKRYGRPYRRQREIHDAHQQNFDWMETSEHC